MPNRDRIHDRTILDTLEAIGGTPFEGDVWRVTRKGRIATRGASANGRWSPSGEFEVLYTSMEREGALAEIGYRLSLEPVWPSKLKHEIHQIDLNLEQTLRLADLTLLSGLGVNIANYKNFDYSATQAIASAAHFLEFDGLIIPSARHGCSNLVIYMDRIGNNARFEVRKTEPVDWSNWKKT
jgi:hypothetical protein